MNEFYHMYVQNYILSAAHNCYLSSRSKLVYTIYCAWVCAQIRHLMVYVGTVEILVHELDEFLL